MKLLGYVLSGSTTRTAYAQLTKDGEERVREGQLVGIRSVRDDSALLLARVDKLQYESNAFRVGDAWALARREGVDVREVAEVLGSFCIAELTILGRVTSRGLAEVTTPPRPGDEVVDLSGVDAKTLFGVDRDFGIVWIESLAGYSSLPIPIDVEALTMHLGVFGETGSGKSYTVGYLLEKLSEIPTPRGPRALPAIVIDANGDYLDLYEEYLRRGSLGAYASVLRMVFPTSRFVNEPMARPITMDLDELEPRELATLIISYRFGTPESSELQLHALTRILEFARSRGLSFNTLFNNDNYLESLIGEVSEELELHTQTIRAVRSAIAKFKHDVVTKYKLVSRSPTLSKEFIDYITKRPTLTIIDFSPDGAPGVPLIVKQLVIAYLATVLYNTFTEFKLRGDERYLLFVIEEAQNYIPNTKSYPIGFSIARDKIALIATQGRKFGICLTIVSQRPVFIDPVVLSMINTWFIHRIAPEDASYISKICGGLPPSLERKLPTLPRGMCLLLGQMNLVGTPLLIKVGSRKVAHRVGKTALIETLSKLPQLTS